MKKTFSVLTVSLLMVAMLMLMLNVQPASAPSVPSMIYIKSDGSIDPSTAPILRSGDVYTFTDNIVDCLGVKVQRNNVVIDGRGFMLQGTGTGKGFDLEGVSGVTIQSVLITGFEYGVYLSGGGNHTLIKNWITGNSLDGVACMHLPQTVIPSDATAYQAVADMGST